MFSDVIRGALVGRLIVAILVDLGGGQVLERNRCLDRLSHIIINSDLNLNLAVGGLRLKGLLTSTQNRLAVLLRDELSLQGVFLANNQVGVINLVDDRCTSNNFLGTISEVRISRNMRLLIAVAITRGARVVRLGRIGRLSRLRRLGRLGGRLRGGGLVSRVLLSRTRGGLGVFRRALYSGGLLGARSFLRGGRCGRLRGSTLAAITRLTRHDVSRSRRRSGGLGRLFRLYSLLLVLDIGVLGDVILLTSGGIFAVLVNSSGSQVFKSNCLVNGLGNTLIDSDLDLFRALGGVRYEGLLTVTDYWVLTSGLVLDLGTQLCLKSVFLASNQVVVLNLIGDDGASLNLIALSLLSLGADGWLHLGDYGLLLIVDVAVIGNLLLFIRVRSFLTVLVDLLGVQVLECDGSLNDALNIVVDLDVNDLLTGRLLRGEGYIALADDLVVTLIILSLVMQLSLQGVFLTRNQVGVGNGVLDGYAGLNLLSVVKFSLSLDRRGPLGVNGLLPIVDVFVSSNLVFIGGASGLLAVLIYLGRYKLLEGNRSVDSRICLLVDRDLDVLLTGGLFRNQFHRAFTQFGLAICLGDQLCLQGVLLTRNKVLIRHSVNNRGALFYTVAIFNRSFRFNLGLEILLLLASSRSRFWIGYYISRLIRGRLGGSVLRSGPLRTGRLRILSRLVRRGLATRVF